MEIPKIKFTDLFKQPSLQKTFDFFGDNPDSAVYIACAIAAFKGIFRPMFTMMDKDSDPETKKFAAIREGLTEVIAIPVYALTPMIIEKAVINKVFKDVKDPKTLKNIKANAKFLSVLASTALIPAVCNLIQPPIMATYKKHQESKKVKPEINSNVTSVPSVNKPSFSGRNPLQARNAHTVKINYGMRVGN